MPPASKIVPIVTASAGDETKAHGQPLRLTLFGVIIAWLRRRDSARRSRRALDWMSEAELHDVGLTRDTTTGGYRATSGVE